MSKLNNLYFGKAGQFVVMSELLLRGWNVAIPEVDIGDDVFAVKDEEGDFFRIQVKASNGKKTNYGFNAVFSLRYDQLTKPITPELFYVFPIRFDDEWQTHIVISRETLYELHEIKKLGTKTKKENLMFTLSFKIKKNTGSGNAIIDYDISTTGIKPIDFNSYKNGYAVFPEIQH